MKNAEDLQWQNKLTPALLKRYQEAGKHFADCTTRIRLEYQGSFKNLHEDIEILSVIEHQIQVRIPLHRLPNLASMRETSALRLA